MTTYFNAPITPPKQTNPLSIAARTNRATAERDYLQGLTTPGTSRYPNHGRW